MQAKLEKEVRFLKAYAVAATLLGAVWLLTAFTLQRGKQKFEEIDVERINVVEKDGKLKMVISNKERQHPGVMDGMTIPRQRPPGILFFNEKGDECGGLIFNGDEKNGQFLVVSFDKFREDQTIQLRHLEGSDGRYFAGLTVWDRLNSPGAEGLKKFMELDKMPQGPEKQAAMKAFEEAGGFGFERVSVGKGRNQTAAVVLSDPKGRARIKMSVDVTGTPKIEFLDETGKVTYSLPEKNQPQKQ
jgi:hypothetical protein